MANYTGTAVGPFANPTAGDWNSEFDADYTPFSPVVTVSYAQRVFSSGLAQWCYYVGALNPTPLSTATTPNWTGAITAYENLGPT